MQDHVHPNQPLPGKSKRTREHIVPQWLQRGFSRSTDPKRAKVAVYRGDAQPLWTNIVNVGVQKSFFTSEYFDGDKTVTELDGEFAVVADELRGRTGGLNGTCAVNACRLFAHLEVRQGATERVIREMWTAAMSTFSSYLRDQNNLQEWLRKPMLLYPNCASAIEAKCMDRLRQTRVRRRVPPVDLRAMIHFAVVYVNSFKSMVAADAEVTGADPRFVANEYADRIEHEEVLEDGIVYNRSKQMLLAGGAKSRVEGYKRFVWKAVRLSKDIVLPDSMVFHEVTDSPLVQNYLYAPATQAASYLPLSSRSMLVGRSKAHSPMLPSAGRMRYLAARASTDFFVAAERKDAYGDLASLIGKHRAFAALDDWRIVVEECTAH